MQRLHEEQRGAELASILEKVSCSSMDDDSRNSISRGADELDLVRSGLDDTMRLAYQQIRETLLGEDKIKDLRTATYVTAIRKIARSYLDVGVY